MFNKKVEVKVYITKYMDIDSNIKDIEYYINIEYPQETIYRNFVKNLMTKFGEEKVIKSPNLNNFLMSFDDNEEYFIDTCLHFNTEEISRKFSVNENITPLSIQRLISGFFSFYKSYDYFDFDMILSIGDYLEDDIKNYLEDFTDDDFEEEITLNDDIESKSKIFD